MSLGLLCFHKDDKIVSEASTGKTTDQSKTGMGNNG